MLLIPAASQTLAKLQTICSSCKSYQTIRGIMGLTQETQVLQAPSIKLQTLSPVHSASNFTLHNDANKDVVSDGPLQEISAVGVVPSIWDPYMNRFRFLATCVTTIADALSDGAAGALIPYVEK